MCEQEVIPFGEPIPDPPSLWPEKLPNPRQLELERGALQRAWQRGMSRGAGIPGVLF